jgi:hypothetical protein
MSTRGSIGFRFDETDHLTYNHCDSYPDGLGLDVLEFCRKNSDDKKLAALKKKAAKLKDTNKVTITPEIVEKLKKWSDFFISSQSTSDWYCLLRKTQGDLKAILSAGYIDESNDFITDSLFCEWAYIINLDTNRLEVYKGFQENVHELGRYANWRPRPGQTRQGSGDDRWNGYYACALVADFNLKRLPSAKTFLSRLNKFRKD